MTRPYLDARRFKGHFFRRLSNLRSIYFEPGWRENRERSLVLGGLVVELDNVVVQGFKSYARTLIWERQKAGTLPKPYARLCSASDYEYLVETAIILAATKPGEKARRVKVPKSPRAVRDPAEMGRILGYILGGVPQSFQNAMALNSTVFQELKYFRHFYSHRCEDTRQKAAVAIPVFGSSERPHPDEFVDTIQFGHSASTYVEWWTQVAEFFEVAV